MNSKEALAHTLLALSTFALPACARPAGSETPKPNATQTILARLEPTLVPTHIVPTGTPESETAKMDRETKTAALDKWLQIMNSISLTPPNRNEPLTSTQLELDIIKTFNNLEYPSLIASILAGIPRTEDALVVTSRFALVAALGREPGIILGQTRMRGIQVEVNKNDFRQTSVAEFNNTGAEMIGLVKITSAISARYSVSMLKSYRTEGGNGRYTAPSRIKEPLPITIDFGDFVTSARQMRVSKIKGGWVSTGLNLTSIGSYFKVADFEIPFDMRITPSRACGALFGIDEQERMCEVNTIDF